MDPLGFFKTKSQYLVVCGIVLLVIACICAYIELSKQGKPVDATLRSISILSFIVGVILLLGVVLFSGYNRFCTASIAEDTKYVTSPGIELQ